MQTDISVLRSCLILAHVNVCTLVLNSAPPYTDSDTVFCVFLFILRYRIFLCSLCDIVLGVRCCKPSSTGRGAGGYHAQCVEWVGAARQFRYGLMLYWESGGADCAL